MRKKFVRECQNSLLQIREDGLHGVNLASPKETLRGIDVLGDDLDRLVTASFAKYRWAHGKSPNLIDPKTFTERQLLFKFFGPVPAPSPSDKLRGPGFVPTSVRHLIKLPERPFIYDKPSLPRDDEIASKTFFYKSNHGSGTHKRIRFPLDENEREKLLRHAKRWLSRAHDKSLGLWWYETMPRNVFIEEDLGSDVADAPDWKFFVCNGRVEIFQVDVDRYSDHVQTLYDREGNFLPYELYYKSGAPVEMPKRLGDMIQVAEAIGQNFDFIRVDMFLKGDTLYMGEIGLVPNGTATAVRSPEMDERLGAAWTPPWLGYVQPGYPGGHYHQIQVADWTW